jgi:hypothetical protein
MENISHFKENLGTWNEIKDTPIIDLLTEDSLDLLYKDRNLQLNDPFSFYGCLRIMASMEKATPSSLSLYKHALNYQGLLIDSKDRLIGFDRKRDLEVQEALKKREPISSIRPINFPLADFAFMTQVIENLCNQAKEVKEVYEAQFLFSIAQSGNEVKLLFEKENRIYNAKYNVEIIPQEVIESLSKCNVELTMLALSAVKGEIIDTYIKKRFKEALRGANIQQLDEKTYEFSFGVDSQNTAKEALEKLFKNNPRLKKETGLRGYDVAMLAEDGKSIIYIIDNPTLSQNAACLKEISSEILLHDLQNKPENFIQEQIISSQTKANITIEESKKHL